MMEDMGDRQAGWLLMPPTVEASDRRGITSAVMTPLRVGRYLSFVCELATG